MQVEQISYGSLKRRRMKGYQIIGKSSGVEASVASTFCQWAPSHNSIQVHSDQAITDAWGLSFFPLSEYYYALARSVHGGPEYSGRGGFAVVTSALILTRKQMSAYDHHGVDLARTALTLGHMILPRGTDEVMPSVTLTRRPLSLPQLRSDWTDSTEPLLPSHAVSWISRETVSLLRDHRKVMIVGHCDPLPILTLILDQLSSSERSQVSFACGLKPSSRRDFRVQFNQARMSPKLQNELDRSGIAPIDIARVLVETS